ncbi:MAG TPA: class I SAM-dependent methyltransferase [Solirubrobacteraceae bacterium]|nr:class I SAM-dependent methyltransferase [Solirubrobacteraceae bacterium]
MAESLQDRSQRLAETRFLGGPKHDFERVGRLGFQVLLAEGLLPGSRVLDVGCGALRLGYWLMRFLDPGCYFGIEPQREMLRVGLEQLVEPEVVQRAQAHFAHNDDFDFSVFDERFDFVVARSIWTHAAQPQIAAMLRSFERTARPEGVFLASYYPASPAFNLGRRWPRLERVLTTLPLERLSPALARLPRPSRVGQLASGEWVGRSHHSDKPGALKHSLHSIAAEAARHGLVVRLLPYRIVHHQYWLRITRADARARRRGVRA